MSRASNPDSIFKALASETRRNILDALKDGPKTTGELCVLFAALNRCTVMQHMNVLEDADLLIVQRKGRQRWNHLNPLPIKHIHDRWIGAYAVYAVGVLDQMKQDIEADTQDVFSPRVSRAS